MNIMKTGVIALKFLRRNAPILISAAAGIGLAALYVLTIKETEEAQEIIRETEEEEVHSFKMAKKLMKIYAPSFICLIITMACIISSTVISQHRIRDLTLYATSIAASYKNYRQFNIEQNGEEADVEVMRECAKIQAKDILPPWEPNENEVLCMMNGIPRFFTVPDLSSAINAFSDINEGFLSDDGPGEATFQTWLDFANACVYDEYGRLVPMDSTYANLGWGFYDLTENDKVSTICPRFIKEKEISGLEYYFIDVPRPQPLEIVRWH